MEQGKSEVVGVRFPAEVVQAMDVARNVGLFKRNRAEFIRDCVRHYIDSHSHIKAEVVKAVGPL